LNFVNPVFDLTNQIAVEEIGDQPAVLIIKIDLFGSQ